MAGTNGLQTAVTLAGGAGEMPGDGDQLELIEADAPLPLSPAVLGRSGPKGGRPVNARNKSTEAWRRWFLGQYRSPLMALGEIYSRSTESLARELQLFVRDEFHNPVRGLDGREILAPDAMIEAFKLQLQAKQAALPYTHQRQPLAVEIKEEKLGRLVINLGGEAGDSAADDLTLRLTGDQQYQTLSKPAPRQSDDEKSDGS